MSRPPGVVVIAYKSDMLLIPCPIQVLMAYLKLALSEVQKDARKGPTKSREARLAWTAWDAAMSLR